MFGGITAKSDARELDVHLMSGNRSAPQDRVSALPFGQWPASWLVYTALSVVIVIYCIVSDRTFFIDQDNYVQNFVSAASSSWFSQLQPTQSLLDFAIVQLFSEEVLWRIWTGFFGSLLDAEAAVVFTVCILNLLVVLAVWRTDTPTFAMVLWLALPVGFAVVGLQQLRQGLGFAVLLFFALQMRRPTLGAAIASMIHTTFVVAFAFAVLRLVLRSWKRVAMIASVLLGCAGAYFGGALFQLFGGRRLLTYSIEEGATSINYVFGGLLFALPSLHLLFGEVTGQREDSRSEALSALALMHLGATAFALCSFFVFPLGAGRVGYLMQLMLIAVLPAVYSQRRSIAGWGILSLLTLYLGYLIAKAFLQGTYSVLTNG